MDQVTRPQLAVYVAAAIAIALLGARHLASERAARPASDGARPRPVEVRRAGGGRVTVDVAGAVRRPGVYRLGPGARVGDAVRRAGGPTRRADLTGINRAARLEDGRQVIVPARLTASAAGVGGAGAVGAGAPGGATGQPVNLNTATLVQLDALQGVGPGIAQRILDYRQEHGGFGSVDELDQVPGIGEGRMAALRDLVRV